LLQGERHALRFPPPWTIDETDARFIVRDATKQALAYRRKHRDKMISCAATKILFDERPRPFSEYCGSA
jgi:hypothetical protein